MSLIKLIRLPNLVIVALTQWVFFKQIIEKKLSENDITTSLDDVQIIYFIIITVLITAGGYITNDIIDQEVDLINKPDQVIVGKKVSLQFSYWLNGFIHFIALLLAFSLALELQKLQYFFLFPLSVILLLAYNYKLKGTPLLGNITVSLFCAGVALILWLAELDGLNELASISSNDYKYVTQLLIWYGIFAFTTNMIREIIKDIEDVEGDQLKNIHTAPVLWGINTARWIVYGLLALLTISLLFFGWLWGKENVQNPLALMSLLLIVMTFIFSAILSRARQKKHYHILSQYLKLIMLMGVAFLFVV